MEANLYISMFLFFELLSFTTFTDSKPILFSLSGVKTLIRNPINTQKKLSTIVIFKFLSCM